MSKITNGQNVENYEKKAKLRIMIIITSIITIVLAVMSLVLNLSYDKDTLASVLMLIALLFFLATTALRRMSDKLEIKVNDKVKALKAEKTQKKSKNSQKTKKNNNK